MAGTPRHEGAPPWTLTTLLGDDAETLLGYTAKGIPKEELVLPGPDFLDRTFVYSDRSPTVLRNLASLYNHGRLAGTGYLSIFPVDQGIEHSAAASFAPNPHLLRPGQHHRAGRRGRVQRRGHHLRACSAPCPGTSPTRSRSS